MSEKYGLIFDMDGVIADTEPPTAQATIRTFDELFGVKGVRSKDFEAGVGKGAEAYIKAAADVHGLKLSQEKLQQACKVREDNFIKIMESSPASAFDGVLKLMEEALDRHDFKVAVATSSSRRMSEPVLKGAKAPYEKMVYVTGDDVSNKKPDPEIFLTAARKMGVEPSSCLVIEDSPGGVQAAKAAGAKCLAVTNTAPAEKLTEADFIRGSLEEINTEKVIQIINERKVDF